MSLLGVPLGSLVSFGSSNVPAIDGDRLSFSGAGAVSAHPGNEPPTWHVATLPARETVTGQPFPLSRTGLGPRPLQAPVISWTYWLEATRGLGDAAAWANLESRLRRMQTWWSGTYSFTASGSSTTYSGQSGQLGDLVVLDAHGAPRRCRALWTHLPDDIPLGQSSFYACPLSFRMFSHWQGAAAIYHDGFIYGTGVIYGG